MSGITITGSVTINQGVTIDTGSSPPPSPTLMLNLDAAGYTSGPWVDTVSSKSFTLNGGASYSSDGGGSIVFDPVSSQYATSTSGVGTLNTWSIEVWHQYAGTNTAGGPCIVTEIWPEPNNQINFALGSLSLYSAIVQAGFYHDSTWFASPTGITLTPGNWYQIVGTYDGATIKLYINNSLVGSTSVTYSSTSGNQGIFLMKRWDTTGSGATQYWGGKLGIVNIYDGAMNTAQIAASWNANKNRFGLGIPTLDITAHNFPLNNPSGSITFNITNEGGSPITETGVIFGLPGQTTYAISVDTCVGSSSTAERTAIRTGGCPGPYTTGLTGSQTVSFNASEFVYPSETINVLAYAVNSFGVAYSPTVLSWTPGICLAEGTLITLADGTSKAIENIEMSDSLKVWDFDNGMFTIANPLWIKQEETTSHYNLLTFNDGSTLKTINQHRIFNKQAGAFTYPMTNDTPIGTITVNEHNQEVVLVDKIVVSETVNYYNVITEYHMNLYANGILTSLRFNNVYHIDEMKFVKDDRELRSLSEFSDIDSRWVDGLRLREQQQPIELISKYVTRLERLEAEMSYA